MSGPVFLAHWWIACLVYIMFELCICVCVCVCDGAMRSLIVFPSLIIIIFTIIIIYFIFFQ
jgi:hypothetical protein